MCLNDGIIIAFCSKPVANDFRLINIFGVPVFFGGFFGLIEFLADVLGEITRKLVYLPRCFGATPPAPGRLDINRTHGFFAELCVLKKPCTYVLKGLAYRY